MSWAGSVLVGSKHLVGKCGDRVKSGGPAVAVKVETSVSRSCPVVGVLVSILSRMVLGVAEGLVRGWHVERGGQRSVVAAVVTVRCVVR